MCSGVAKGQVSAWPGSVWVPSLQDKYKRVGNPIAWANPTGGGTVEDVGHAADRCFRYLERVKCKSFGKESWKAWMS